MRHLLTSLSLLLPGLAHAQGVPNGGFETGALTSWTDLSAGAGQAVVVTSAAAGIAFPEGTHAARLRTGTQQGNHAGSIRSASFLLTHTQVSLDLRMNDTTNIRHARLRQASDDALVVESDLTPATANTFQTWALPAEPSCGDSLYFTFYATNGADMSADTLYLDHVRLDGPVCAIFTDADGDGRCPQGLDLDGDGTCTGLGEPTPGIVHDCDDSDPEVYVGAPEIPGDGIDQSCDGRDACYLDADGDGYGSGTVIAGLALTCTGPGESPLTGDCDDGDPAVHPGAVELPADGIDQDCDGLELCWLDADGDGYGSTLIPSTNLLCDGPGEATIGGDCDDGDPTVYPGAPEIPGDGIDQSCDGRDACYLDADGDGYGSTTVIVGVDLTCSGPGESKTDDDCDDTDPDVNPGAVEIPGNGIDDNCDGADAPLPDTDPPDTDDTDIVDPPDTGDTGVVDPPDTGDTALVEPPDTGDTGDPIIDPPDTSDTGRADTSHPGDTAEPPDTDTPDTDVPDTDTPDTDTPDTDVPDTDTPAVPVDDLVFRGGACGGCAQTGPPGGGWLVLAGLALMRRRQRRPHGAR